MLRFSVFEFDAAGPELRRKGRRVHLQEMPLRVLQMLLEHPNELVTREDFFARLWPHDASGILDDNLNTAVRKLRLALNDSAHQPQFIETVPKRGYRFLAPILREEQVREKDASAALRGKLQAPTDPSSAPPAAPGRRAPMKLIASMAVAMIGILVLAGVALNHRASETPSSPADPTTLAVLPFVNASGRPDDEYFSHGLTEELIDRLSRSGKLRVVSRTSSFALKGKDLGASEAGRLLGARSLVEGSVRRDGERLRINVRLVNAEDGYQLWSEVYDRRTAEVIAIQEEIAFSIANALTGHLMGASSEVQDAPVPDPLAYDLYLKGRFYWHRRTQEGLLAAVDYFEQAVNRAPNYAPSWAGLADAYAVLGFYDYLAPENAFPKAQAAARRALELDPINASAEATLGYAALYYDWNLIEAETRFRQAIAHDPNQSKAHQWYANLLTAAGRFEEAEREMRRAQQLEPLSMIASAALGWVLYHAGRHEEALAQYRLTLALDPNFELAYLWSGWTLEALGRYDEALAVLREAVSRSGGAGISTASLAHLHALRGERAEAERLLSQLLNAGAYVPSYEIAKAWFALGMTDKGGEWLQRSIEERSHSVVFLHVDPQLAMHRQESSFVRVAERVHFAAGGRK